jgi:hypothetical protein
MYQLIVDRLHKILDSLSSLSGRACPYSAVCSIKQGNSVVSSTTTNYHYYPCYALKLLAWKF